MFRTMMKNCCFPLTSCAESQNYVRRQTRRRTAARWEHTSLSNCFLLSSTRKKNGTAGVRPWRQNWTSLRLTHNLLLSINEIDLHNEWVSTKLFLSLLIPSVVTRTMYMAFLKGIHTRYIEKSSSPSLNFRRISMFLPHWRRSCLSLCQGKAETHKQFILR